MNHPVLSALLPVVLLIAMGFIASRVGWIRGPGTKDLSNLVFMLLTPALLFRTMSRVQVQSLNFSPIATYLVVVGLMYAVALAWRGWSRQTAVLALAATFSNTLMIGVPLVGLAYGDAGLVTLFTLISVHSLVLLTGATLVLELAVAREQGGRHQAPGMLAHTVFKAMRGAILHPVPLPILLGLAFAQTGWTIPEVVDRPLQLLGNAFGPLALVLVGVTLAYTPVRQEWRGALRLALCKNLLHPMVMALGGWALGLRGLPWAVMVLAAALPIGANVFLFSQRYQVAENQVTAGVAVSTVLGLISLSLVLSLLGLWV